MIGMVAVPQWFCGGWRLLDRADGFAEVAAAESLPETAVAAWSFHGGLIVGFVQEAALDERKRANSRGAEGPQVQPLRSELRLHDASDGRLRCRIALDQKSPESEDELPNLKSVAVDPNGRHLMVWTFAGTPTDSAAADPPDRSSAERSVFRVFDTATGSQVWERKAFFLDPDGPVKQHLLLPPTFSPDGETVAVWSAGPDLTTTLRFLRTADAGEVRRIEMVWDVPVEDVGTSRLLFSPDGSTVFAKHLGQAGGWEVSSGRRLFHIPPGDAGTHGLVVSDDGRLLFLREGGVIRRENPRKAERISRVHVWDVRLGQRLLTFAEPRSAAPSKDAPGPDPGTGGTLRFTGGRLEWLTPNGIRVYDGTPRGQR